MLLVFINSFSNEFRAHHVSDAHHKCRDKMQTVRFGNRVEQCPKFGGPNLLLVTGYIQSERQIDSGNLLRWLLANWSPVDGKLVRHNAYCEWSRLGPAYWHAHVHGKPAVAASACHCMTSLRLLPNTQNLDSLIEPDSDQKF
jgi:hypothetical protein